MGITSWLRQGLGIDDSVDYSSKSYIGGEITEFVVETSITIGGAALRKHAVKYAGKAGRLALGAGTRNLQKTLGIHAGMGQIHHINPIRAGRFPLPFKWASKSWNVRLYRGVSRGFNISHWRVHQYLKMLDSLDIARTYTSPIRTAISMINQKVNTSGSGKKAASRIEDDQIGNCLYAPDITIEVNIEIDSQFDYLE